MILFYVTRESEPLKLLYRQLKEEESLPVAWLNQENLIRSGLFHASNINNNIEGKIITSDDKHEIDLNSIRLCYIAHFPYVFNEWIAFENHYDKLYAQQEWNASINAMFLSHPEVKFVNPLMSKYDLNSEMEQLLVLQKFNVKTVEMILTNNPQEAHKTYDLWNRQMLFKTVRNGYDTASIMEIPDLARLEKLTLSPVLFQKIVSGNEITVCLVGEKILARKSEYINDSVSYQETEIPDELRSQLIQLSDHLNFPLMLFYFLHQEDSKQYLSYGMTAYPDFDNLYNLFGENFLTLLKSYLVEEYKK